MTPTRRDFMKLAAYDRRLLKLEKDIRAYVTKNSDNDCYCANAAWYVKFKPIVCELVGWESKNPNLNSEDAYDIAYQYLYTLLPECNHKGIC